MHQSFQKFVGSAIILGILISAPIALPAQAQGNPNVCAAEPDSLRRLDCFDRMFPLARNPDGKSTKVPNIHKSKWISQRERSPIDDSPGYRALLEPTNSSYTGLGNSEAYLIIGCRDNTTSVVVTTNMFMRNEKVAVTTRIGTAPATTTKWVRSTDYKALGLWSGARAIPFLKSLSDDIKLVVRIEDDDRLTAEYDLDDISAHIEEIRADCNW